MTDVSPIDRDTARYDFANPVPGDPYEVALLGKQSRDTAALISRRLRIPRNPVDGTGRDSDAGHRFQRW